MAEANADYLFRGRVVDRTAGIVLYRFEVPLDAAAPLPLGSFLPTGSFRIESLPPGLSRRYTVAPMVPHARRGRAR